MRNHHEKRQRTEAWARKGTTRSSGPLLTTLFGLLVKLVGCVLLSGCLEEGKGGRGRAHWSSRW